jgi:putative transposase
MARRPRLIFPGAVYHVMSRGNRKSLIVEDDDDRRTFSQIVSETAEDCQVRIYACCLMGTHYHVLLDTPRANVSDFFCRLNSSYSSAFNRRHARVGHTFEQRFESCVVQREKYLRRVARYVVLNPVKAGLCRDAAAWAWSTYRATAGLADAPSWLYLDWLRWAFRADCLSDAQARYRAYVQDPSGLSWSFDGEAAVGTPRFKKAVGASLRANGHGENRWIPNDWRRCARLPLEHVFAGEESDHRSRDALIVIAHVEHGYRLAEIAKYLALSPSTVSKILSRIRRQQSGE